MNLYLDTETWPLRPGRLAPRMVCTQSAYGNEPVQILLRKDSLERLDTALRSDCLLTTSNGSFDWAVAADTFPELTGPIFRALGAGRGRDVEIREKLIELKNGTLQNPHPKGHWSLAGMAKRRLGVEMDKGDEAYRLKYALLDGIDPSKWPANAVAYATDDIVQLRAVDAHQLREFEPKDEWLQVAASFCLHLAAVWGLRTDRWRVGWARMVLMQDDQEAVRLLEEAGLLVGGTVKRDKVREAVIRACDRAGKQVPMSEPSKTFPQGQVSYSAEVTEELAPFDPALACLSRHTYNTKLMGTYLEPMDVDHAMTSSPNVLVATGRTSWRGGKLKEYNPWWPDLKYEKVEEKTGTNLQNWPVLPGIRECVRARPGTYLCSVDYSGIELRTLAQVCLWLLGKSTFADGYQKDPLWDAHSYFGGELVGISYEEALKRRKSDPKFDNGPRQTAKNTNFALPGGVGAPKMHTMFADLFNQGQLDKLYSLNECYGIKRKWLSAYPEMPEYFEYIDWLKKSGKPLVQFVSERVRGRIGFCDGANTYFQGLAADLAKRALFYVTQACYCEPDSPLYGSRVVAFIHDELLLEVLIEKAHEAAQAIVDLMMRAYNECCPDVPGHAEPALMTYWTKAAKLKFNSEGRMIPWD